MWACLMPFCMLACSVTSLGLPHNCTFSSSLPQLSPHCGCRGQLRTNCTGETFLWPGPQCFVNGLEEEGACSPASTNVSLADILQDGSQLDGAEGSLCVLATLPSVCQPGLLCTAMTTEVLNGTGIGFCAGSGESAWLHISIVLELCRRQG